MSTWRHAAATAITPGRLGMLAALAALQATRNVAMTFFDASWTDTLRAYGVFTAINFAGDLPYLFIVCFADRASRQWTARWRVALLVLAVVVGSAFYAACYAVAFEFGAVVGNYPWPGLWRTPALAALNFGAFFARGMLYGGLLTGILYFLVRQEKADESLMQLEAERSALARQAVEADLLLLQAQIEPHFLFNTLANAKRLYLTDPASGSELLANLGGYLRATLPRLREGAPTLGREVELVQAYLNVLRTRMGTRLQYDVEVPHALRVARIPPMILLTLVENAVKHGVGPIAEGGRIHVGARTEGQNLQLWVADTGRGFAKTMGEGVGLANIRSRLKALHGGNASFAIKRNSFGGITARVVLPYACASADEGVPT